MLARSVVSAVTGSPGICRGLEGRPVGSACPLHLRGRRAAGEACLSQCPAGGGAGEATLGLETPRQIFLPTWAAGLRDRDTVAETGLAPRAEREVRPRPWQRALAAGPPGTALPWASLEWKPA